MTAKAEANAAPQILPELREWVGGEGQFAASAAKRVVYGQDSLKVMAEDFAADFQIITGVKLEVVQGTAAQAGDIFFTLGADKVQGLKDEATCSRRAPTASPSRPRPWRAPTGAARPSSRA